MNKKKNYVQKLVYEDDRLFDRMYAIVHTIDK